MIVLGLDHYNLRASRELLEELCRFYTEVVGLEVGYRPPFNNFGYWLYAGDHAVLHLSESSPDDATPKPGPTTFNHTAFSCSDPQKFEQKLTQLGVDYRTARVPELDAVQLFLRDPAGNGVELNFPDA